MKLIQITFCILGLGVFAACTNTSSPTEPVFTSKDSTEIIPVILDSMRSEMNARLDMQPGDDMDFGYMTVCGPRSVFTIRINNQDDILMQGELKERSISQAVFDYYFENLDENDVTNNAPMYSRINREQILQEIESSRESLVTIQNTPGVLESIIEFKKNVMNEWEYKLEVLNLIGKDELPEPNHSARVEVNYKDKSTIQDAVFDSVFISFYRLRELDCERYFAKTYAELFWRATEHKDSLSLKRIKACRVLHPVQVVDYNESIYSRYNNVPPPPPFIK